MAAEKTVIWLDQPPDYASERLSELDFTSPCDGVEREAGYLLPQLLFPWSDPLAARLDGHGQLRCGGRRNVTRADMGICGEVIGEYLRHKPAGRVMGRARKEIE